METGAFIVIDGPNGTGKTCALKSAAVRLRADGHNVIETREPGGTPLAENLRAMILNADHDMDTTTQLLLLTRSESRRVGKECVRTCRSRGPRYHKKQTTQSTT